MSSTTSRIVAAGVLAALLGGLTWMRLRGPGMGGGPAPMTGPDAATAQVVAAMPSADDEPQRPAALTTPTRDPFVPPATLQPPAHAPGTAAQAAPAPDATTPPTLKVQGILWGVTPPRAIINDQILTEGDMLEGARVVTITKEGVTVEFAGSQYVVRTPASPPATRRQAVPHSS